MNDALEVGKQLVELCRKGKTLEAVEKLYSPKIVSLEAAEMPQVPARTEGIEAIKRKNQWWNENHIIHNAQVDGPWPHGDRFVVHYKFETTPKVGPQANQRMTAEEAALYTVEDGKIVQEEFFYQM